MIRQIILDTLQEHMYRHFDYQSDSWRYRNKFTLRAPWKFTRWQIQPFVWDEIFIGFGKLDQFNQNRFSAGLAATVSANIKLEIYYMLQSVKATDAWVDANVLGTKLKIAF